MKTSIVKRIIRNEPHHDKTNVLRVRPAWIQWSSNFYTSALTAFI
jgi:hypothetical protein